MDLQKKILEPKKSRKSFFDGADLDAGTFTHLCSNCEQTLDISCREVSKACWYWPKTFSSEEKEQLYKLFSIGNSKTPSSNWPWHQGHPKYGWPTFLNVICNKCCQKYVFLFDFHEYRNSVYQVTIQGIASVES